LAGFFDFLFFAESQIPELKAIRDVSWLTLLCVGIILIGIAISVISTHRSVMKYLKMSLDDLY